MPKRPIFVPGPKQIRRGNPIGRGTSQSIMPVAFDMRAGATKATTDLDWNRYVDLTHQLFTD